MHKNTKSKFFINYFIRNDHIKFSRYTKSIDNIIKIKNPINFVLIGFLYIQKFMNYLLCLFSSETVNLFLPAARLDDKTLRPSGVDILSRNPCLFIFFLTEG